MTVRLEPVDYDPFAEDSGPSVTFEPVDYDPFAEDSGPSVTFEPVDYDPFAEDYNPSAETEETVPGDYSRSLAIGLNRFGQTVGRAVDVVGNIDPTRLLTESGEGVLDRAGQGIEAFYKEKTQEDIAALSPAMKAANELRYTTDVEESWTEAPVKNLKSAFQGEAWKSPAKMAGSLLQSAPSTVLGMGTGMGIATGLIKEGVSSGLAGVVGGFIGEGGTASVESGKEIYDMVLNAPHEIVSQTPEYQKAWAALTNEPINDKEKDQQARELIADHAAMKSMAIVFGATGMLGSVSGHYMGSLLGGDATGGLARKIATEGVLETLQEIPQSGYEVFEKNLQAKKYINPNQDIWEGVKEASVEGGVQGFAMGLAGGALAAKGARQDLLGDDTDIDPNTGFDGAPIDQEVPAPAPGTPFAEQADSPYVDIGDSDTLFPSQEQEDVDQMEAEILAQQGGQAPSGRPIQVMAGEHRAQNQKDMDQQARMDQESLNAPGTRFNEGQAELDAGIAEFRRQQQMGKELDYHQRRQGPGFNEGQYWREAEADIKGQQADRAEQKATQIKQENESARHKQFFQDQEDLIEGRTALSGWHPPKPILKNPNAPSKSELKRRQSEFDRIAAELGDNEDDGSGSGGGGQKIEREVPRGIPGAPVTAMTGPPVINDRFLETPETQEALNAVNTEPTEKQKEAGNYKKASLKVNGLNIKIENPDGSKRSGISPDGKKWETTMSGHYGYFSRTEGKDGDQVDVIVTPGTTESPKVFIVDQVDPKTGKLDEHKVIMGVDTAEDAETLYMSNYEEGWQGMGGITEMAPNEFKSWVGDKKATKKPLYEEPPLPVPDAVPESPATAMQGTPSSASDASAPQGASSGTMEGTIKGPKKKAFSDNPTESQEKDVPKSGQTSEDAVYNHLKSGDGYKNINDARKQISEATGKEIKPGTVQAKQADEAIELAAVKVAREIVAKDKDPKQIFGKLVDLQDRMPNLAVRTSTSIKNQAYSTPLPLAYLASKLAGITKKTTVFEPSAGNGALVIGANVSKTTVNEINPDRYRGLWNQKFKEVLSGDGTELKVEPQDVVIANPPFGTVKVSNKSKIWRINAQYETTQIDHAMVLKSLESMKPDGKAVFIIGSVNDKNKTLKGRKLLYRNKDKVRFFKTLYDNYNVVDHFSVDGKLYSKQGASWPVDVITIHGKGKSSKDLPGVEAPPLLTTIEELRGKINETDSMGMGTKGTKRRPDSGRGDMDTGRGSDIEPGLSPVPGEQDRNDDSAGTKKSSDAIDGKTGRDDAQPGAGIRPGLDESPGQLDAGVTPSDSGKSNTDRHTINNGNSRPVTDKASDKTRPKSKKDSGKRQSSKLGGKSDHSIEQELAQASESDIDGMLDDVFGEEPAPAKAKETTKKKITKKIVKKAALESISGVKEAVAGLGELFTPKNTLGSGPVFNEETYIAAKPHFEKAWEHAKKAGYSLKELIQHLAKQFDAAIRPYLKRFLVDQQEVQKEKSAKKKILKKKLSPKSTSTQVAYTPASKSSVIGTLTPINMSTAMNEALSAIEKKHGDIDKFVADKLGYTMEEILGKDGKYGYFSGEQVDAIALAIQNIDDGAGFIIGDQTGVGKGRVVAAMIRYSIQKGITPIFVTEKPNLYADMYRDLSDIGMADVDNQILVTNAGKKFLLTEDGSKEISTKSSHNNILREAATLGEIPNPYKMVFTTYDQMNQAVSARRDMLSSIIGNSMLIMDEAHNAGGTEGAQVKGGKYPRSIFFRELVRGASSVFYSSATYAKRPGVMDLYSKTDMSLAVDDINDLSGAIEAGGVPLQQVVAALLTQAGQYVRRERSFEGIEYATTTVKVDRKISEAAAKSFAAIKAFSDTFVDAAIGALGDSGASTGTSFTGGSSAGDAKIQSTGFSSVMHNLVNQMLLSMKTYGAIDEAIEVFKKDGKKPIITLSNTMGSFIKTYAENNDLVPGDAMALKFNDLIFEYLDKTRRYTEEDAFQKGKRKKKYISDAELGPEGVAAFKKAKRLIYSLDMGDLPVSPVDHIRSKLEEAGMTVSEITGRDNMIEYRTDGTQRYAKRSGEEKSIKGRTETIYKFNTDEIDALIINRSGSTGLSLHAIPKFEGHSPAQRHMIVLQAEANIDTHMQMLGRINRAGQVNTPSYSQLVGDTPAEMRPAAVLAAKMASLNANTTASTDSDVTAKGVVNFMNKYGDKVVATIMTDMPEWHKALGRPLKDGKDGLEKLGAARKVTGKIPILPLKEQEKLYKMIEEEYNSLIDQLDTTGENDLEAKTFDADAKVLKTATVSKKIGSSPFQGKATAQLVDMKKLGKSYTGEQVQQILEEKVYGEKKGVPISDTVERGMDIARQTYNDAMESFDDYSRDIVDSIEKEERREAQETKLNANKNDFRKIAGQAYPGRAVQLVLDDEEFFSTILEVKQSGEPKNPLALGTWKVTLAIADSTRRLTFSFRDLQKTDWNPSGQLEAEDLEKFDNATMEAREERTIITGNMLSAYSKFKKGRIINYTSDKGIVNQGILMPKSFNLDEANEERSVILTNANKTMKVLDEQFFLKTRDDLAISPQKDGSFAVSSPASKAKGSKYYLNSGILKAVGQDFVKVGSRMRVVTSDKNKIKRLVKYVLLDMNETFRNTADAQKIRRLLGIETEKLGTGDKPATQYSTLPGEKDSQYQVAQNKTTTTPTKSNSPITPEKVKAYFKSRGLQTGTTPDGKLWVRTPAGLGFTVETVDRFSDEEYQIAINSGVMDKDGHIAGNLVGHNIKLAMYFADRKTLDHELFHLLEKAGILTKKEIFLLTAKAKQYAKKNSDFKPQKDQRENRANYMSEVLDNREQFRGTPLGDVLQKAVDFIDALYQIARETMGKDRNSVRQIARGMESGDIYKRPANKSQDGLIRGKSQYRTTEPAQQSDEEITKALFKQDPKWTDTVKDFANKAKSKEQRKLATDRFRAKTLDHLHFIQRRLGDRAYRMHRMLTGIKSATFAMFLEHGALSWDGDAPTVKTKGKGVLPFLQSIGPDYQNLLLWISAKRAEQLDAEGRENWITADKRAAIFRKVGTHAKNGQAWEFLNKRFQTINKNVLDFAEAAGLIDPESRALWEQNFYIPFYRVFENEATREEFMSGPGGAKKHITAQIRQLKGGEAQIGDLLQNSLTNWMFLIDAAARNKARGTAFDAGTELNIITEVPKKDLINILGAQTEKKFAVMKDGASQASALFDYEDDARNHADKLSNRYGKAYGVEPRKTTTIKFGNMKDLGVLSFQRDGKPVYFKTDDQDLFESMSELDQQRFNFILMKFMGKAKRTLSYGATFGPAFRIRNMVRDSVHTAVVSKSFIPFVDTARGLVKAWREDPEYVEFMASGFGFGSSYVHSDDPEVGAKFIKRIMKSEGKGAVARILTSPKRILDVWEKIGSASENAARVQLYSNLKNKGQSSFDAGFEGRDLMDFSMKGSSTTVQTLTRTIPFLNARFQGLYKLARAAKENPKSFVVKSAMLTAASLALWGAFKDDDRYKELQDWDKWTYFHFWFAGEHYRIPKPFEIGALFCSLPESIGNVMNGTEEGKFIAGWAANTARSVFNIDMPQAFKPIIEGEWANKNTFTGRPVVSEYMGKLPKEEQYNPWTSVTAREIGKQLGLSPLKIEHYISGYLATMGKIILDGTDILVHEFGDYPEEPSTTLAEDTLGRSKAWGLGVMDPDEPARSTKFLTRFYERYDDLDSASSTFNHFKRSGQSEKALKWYKESVMKILEKGVASKIKIELSKINAKMRLIQNSKILSGDEKKRQMLELQKLRNAMTKRYFEAIKNNK